ncbi:MAG: hypothetical protein HW416_2072 [Chloroflexi bacterium]|nr:hypothetical protein [Chloroflexota bacterium]
MKGRHPGEAGGELARDLAARAFFQRPDSGVARGQ